MIKTRSKSVVFTDIINSQKFNQFWHNFFFIAYLNRPYIHYLFMQLPRSTRTPEKKKSSYISQQEKEERIEKAREEAAKRLTKKIILGICAMKKKVESKPMKEIVKRIKCDLIQVIEMWECLEKNYKEWPKVDALICFYSDGFPYLNAWKYVKKNKPFLINDLQKQELLWDRTAVYDILKKIHIPVAKHYMVYKNLDYIEEIQKKTLPQEPEGHKIQYTNINENLFKDERNLTKRQQEKKRIGMPRQLSLLGTIETIEKQVKQYEPKSTKFNFQDSKRPHTLRQFHRDRLKKIEKFDEIEQSDDCVIFKNKTNVYKLKKPFVEKPFESQNHNICIYYPKSMGGGRKMLFRKIKNQSSKYEERENLIRRDGNYIYEEFLPTNAFDIKVYTIGCYYMYAQARKSPTLDGVVQRDSTGKQQRFPIILTPQEKFIANKIVQQFGQQVCGFDLLRANGKSYVCDVNGWSFVKNNSSYWDDCAVILKKKIFCKFYPELHNEHHGIYQRFRKDLQNGYIPRDLSKHEKKEQLRSIVSIFRHGDRSPKQKMKFKTGEEKFIKFYEEFAENNKNQIKVKQPKSMIRLLEVVNDIIADSEKLKDSDLTLLCQMKSVLESGGHFEGINRKCQIKVDKRNEEGKPKKLKIVVKWGGQLSLKGCRDAIQLGKRMRMEKYSDSQDLLSLHSSYKHDLKTYSSDQGRCIKTAASFLKGFLNIEGGLAPIIISLVKSHKKAQNLLDCTSEQNHSSLSQQIVRSISDMFNSDKLLIDSYLQYVDKKEVPPAMLKIIKQIGKPRQKLQLINDHIMNLVAALQEVEIEKRVSQDRGSLVSGGSFDEDEAEDIILVYKRWAKLQKDFYEAQDKIFNISKVPQIYDTIRHDLSKNSYIFSSLDFNTKDFLNISKVLAEFVVPNEYGITTQQKILTGQDIASPLLEKVSVDLNFWKERQYQDLYWKYMDDREEQSWKHIRTRLYFTSSSHMYALLHLMTLGNKSELLQDLPQQNINKIKEYLYMAYLSHIQFRLYENFALQSTDPYRFRVQITLSPQFNKGQKIAEVTFGDKGFTIDQIKNFLKIIVKPRKQGNYEMAKAQDDD